MRLTTCSHDTILLLLFSFSIWVDTCSSTSSSAAACLDPLLLPSPQLWTGATTCRPTNFCHPQRSVEKRERVSSKTPESFGASLKLSSSYSAKAHLYYHCLFSPPPAAAALFSAWRIQSIPAAACCNRNEIYHGKTSLFRRGTKAISYLWSRVAICRTEATYGLVY